MKLDFSHTALFHTDTKVCFIYFGQDCNNKIIRSGVFIVNFEHISHLFLVSLSLALNK